MNHTQETKDKLKVAMTGKVHSAETKAKLAKAMTGKKLDALAIAKMQASLKRTWDKKLGRGEFAVKVSKPKRIRKPKVATA